MTPSLIATSNYRARVAILVCRLCRDGATMAELRDALNQRRNMRESARFSLWFMANEERLRDTFTRRWVRRELDHRTGDMEKDFSTFIHKEYANNP